jgi:hypothetical protein
MLTSPIAIEIGGKARIDPMRLKMSSTNLNRVYIARVAMRKTITRTVVPRVGNIVRRKYGTSNPTASDIRDAQRTFRIGRETRRTPSTIIAGRKYFRYGELRDDRSAGLGIWIMLERK